MPFLSPNQQRQSTELFSVMTSFINSFQVIVIVSYKHLFLSASEYKSQTATNLVFSILPKLNYRQHWAFWVAKENCLPVLEQCAASIADLNV